MTKSKSPSESTINMREMVMPQHANPLGTIFGGVIMSWVDIAASMSATKHCGTHVVTAHVDDMSFMAPVGIGHHVSIVATVNFAGRTSMEVGVKVESEDPISGKKQVTTTAYVTMVSIDKSGNPCQVPKIVPNSKEEQRRFENAEKRTKSRRELAKNLKS